MLSKADKNYLFENFVTKTELKSELLDLRNDFFTRFDAVMSELKAIREDNAAMMMRILDHEERVTTIEQKIAF